MKNILICSSLVLLTLFGACASHPQQQPIDSTTVAAATTDTSADNGQQTLRANYMACVQRQADSGAPGVTQTKSAVTSTLDAYEDTLRTMRDGFRDYLNVSMSSSGARKAADRVTKDTREKTRVYLMGYVDHVRCLTKSR